MKALVSIPLLLLACLSCRKSDKSVTVPPSEGPSGLKGAALVNWQLARCAAAVPDGVALVYDIAEGKAPSPTCLGLVTADGRVMSSSMCPGGGEAKGAFLAIARGGKWETQNVRSSEQTPFKVVHGWIAAPGSLDARILTAEEPISPMKNLISDPLSGRQFDTTIYFLKTQAADCPAIGQVKMEAIPYLYPFGVPMTFKSSGELSPEWFLGARPLDCKSTVIGSLLYVKERTGSVEGFAGFLSRHYRSFSDRCDERGDEIFTNVLAVGKWIEEQKP